MKNFLFTTLLALNFIHACGQSKALVPYRIGNKWGYSDTIGKIKIPVKYDTAILFAEGYTTKGRQIAVLSLNGKPIVINDLGAVIVPAKYDYITPMQMPNDVGFFVTAKRKLGIYANGKEIIPAIYDALYLQEQGYFEAQRNGKWGLINSQGKIVMPVIYSTIWREASGPDSLIMHGSNNDERKTYRLKAMQNHYSGNDFPPPAEMIGEAAASESDFASVKKEYGLDSGRITGNSGIIYKNGKPGIYLPGETQKIYMFTHNYTLHHVKYFNQYGRTQWNNRKALVIAGTGGKYGLIDEQEKEVLPFVYDGIEDKLQFFVLRQNGKIGFYIPDTFYSAIQPTYDQYLSRSYLSANSQWNFMLFKVVSHGKVGYVGENGIAFFKD